MKWTRRVRQKAILASTALIDARWRDLRAPLLTALHQGPGRSRISALILPRHGLSVSSPLSQALFSRLANDSFGSI
jgi:hypothetical protein